MPDTIYPDSVDLLVDTILACQGVTTNPATGAPALVVDRLKAKETALAFIEAVREAARGEMRAECRDAVLAVQL